MQGISAGAAYVCAGNGNCTPLSCSVKYKVSESREQRQMKTCFQFGYAETTLSS